MLALRFSHLGDLMLFPFFYFISWLHKCFFGILPLNLIDKILGFISSVALFRGCLLGENVQLVRSFIDCAFFVCIVLVILHFCFSFIYDLIVEKSLGGAFYFSGMLVLEEDNRAFEALPLPWNALFWLGLFFGPHHYGIDYSVWLKVVIDISLLPNVLSTWLIYYYVRHATA